MKPGREVCRFTCDTGRHTLAKVEVTRSNELLVHLWVAVPTGLRKPQKIVRSSRLLDDPEDTPWWMPVGCEDSQSFGMDSTIIHAAITAGEKIVVVHATRE